MREKIARALYEATPFNLTEGPYERQSDLYKRNCLLLADAALYALMEPTEGMRNAAHSLADIHGYKILIQAAKDGK